MNSITENDLKIYYENLAVLKNGDNERLPLEELDADSHIHGGLRIVIGGRVVPHLGFWNADDVCFGEWLRELDSLLSALDGEAEAVYTYDEGEQGQPAFVSQRQGDSVFLSIVDSLSSGAEGDAAWQRIEFRYSDLREQVQRMRSEFTALNLKVTPTKPLHWLKTIF